VKNIEYIKDNWKIYPKEIIHETSCDASLFGTTKIYLLSQHSIRCPDIIEKVTPSAYFNVYEVIKRQVIGYVFVPNLPKKVKIKHSVYALATIGKYKNVKDAERKVLFETDMFDILTYGKVEVITILPKKFKVYMG